MNQKISSPPKNPQENIDNPENIEVKNRDIKLETSETSSDKSQEIKKDETQKIVIQPPIEAMIEKEALKPSGKDVAEEKPERKSRRKKSDGFKEKVNYQRDSSAASVQPLVETKKPEVESTDAGSRIEPKTAGEQKIFTRGVAHFQNNMVRIAGGIKLHAGDAMKIGEREFELKHLEPSKKLLYWSIFAVGVITLFFIFQFGFTGYKDAGKIVGIVIDKGTGNFLPNAQIQIEKFGTKVKSNDLGFFVLDVIPPGNYQVKTQLEGFNPVVENAVVLKKKITTIVVELFSEREAASTGSGLRQNNSRVESGTSKQAASLETSYGSIKIQSNVPDVVVYVGNEYLGKGNRVFSSISSGTRQVSLYKDGYQEWTGKVKVVKGKTSTLNANLNKVGSTSSKPSTSENVSYLARAQKEYNAGNYAGAVENYTNWLNSNFDNADAYMGRGNSYLKLGDGSKAIADFSKGAEIFEKKGDFSKAALCYTSILKLKAEDMNSLYKRGLTYISMNEFEKAVPDLKKVTQENPKFYNGFMGLGNAQYSSGDYKTAVETYSQAKKLNSNDKQVYVNLALTYTALKDKSNARKNYEKFKELTTLVSREQMKDNAGWVEVLRFIGENTEKEF